LYRNGNQRRHRTQSGIRRNRGRASHQQGVGDGFGDSGVGGLPAVINLLLLVKYEKPYLKILRQLLPFAEALKAHIDVLQIKDAPDRSESRIIKEWSEEFAGADISFHMFATNAVEEMALDFADSHHNNLIALAVHERTF
jgi:hypothetical protein